MMNNALAFYETLAMAIMPEGMPSMPCKPEPRVIGRPAPVGYGKRIDRNTQCPCGSGKKFKKCCYLERKGK
jgi:uncharacterized protein YecA (UPF0149 family)